MAEGTSANQDDTVCPTFINSPHEEGRPVSSTVTRRVKNCIYFQSGTCRYGSRCRFAHVLNSTGPALATHYNGHTLGKPIQLPSSASLPTLRNLNRGEVNEESLPNENLNGNEPKKKSSNPPNWADAPEFIPRSMLTYASAVKLNNPVSASPVCKPVQVLELCADFMFGECHLDEMCPYVHGDKCDLCEVAILNPYDENQRKEHIEGCEKAMEQDMELSFAIQRSMDKSCGICLDVVIDKMPLSERRFGILDSCSHVFCLACIRRWRQQKNAAQDSSDLDNALNPTVTRSCPTCRVSSDFIIPSRYWVETEEEKQKLISDYKGALSQKHCKYFKRGNEKCPFGGNCFYLHALPDGTKVELPKPERRRRHNQNGELDVVDNFTLWEFLEFRDDTFLRLGEHVYNLSYSDTETSEDSDVEWNVVS